MRIDKNRDFSYIKKIKEHAETLFATYNSISKSVFLDETVERKAVLFDLLQIGELVSQLTKTLQLSMDKKEFEGIISVRNHIVHGYDKLNNCIIVDCIEKELSPFIETLELNAKKIYIQTIKSAIGQKITVLVDKEKDAQNFFNFGHINELSDLNGNLQKVILIDVNGPIFQCKAMVVSAIASKNNDDIILLAAINEIKIDIAYIQQHGYKDYQLL